MIAQALLPILPDPDSVGLDSLSARDGVIVFALHTTRSTVACPLCQCLAHRTHSHYQRKLLDLPWQGNAVRFELSCRKFFCDNRDCKRRIFNEPIPAVATKYARKTCRLADALRQLCYLVGGEAAAKIALSFGLLVSPDALLDGLKREAVQKKTTPTITPRVLGIDDFAFRRGHTYGTILVDLEKRVPVDLLPDREAKSVEEWLKAHPGVEIISRDRGNPYIEGATRGAPTAIQVADRWHLFKNLGDALEKFLTRKHKLLRLLKTTANVSGLNTSGLTEHPTISETSSSVDSKDNDNPHDDRAARRQRRIDQYKQVVELHASGMNICGIARQTNLSRKTIRSYLGSDGFPERRGRPSAAGKLTPFTEHIRRRFGEGCRNTAQLHKEIVEQGFTGKNTIVKVFVATLRNRGPSLSSAEEEQEQKRRDVLSSRKLSWLLTNQESPTVTDTDREAMKHLTEFCPEVALAATLGTHFCTMVRERRASELSEWLEAVKQSGVAELQTFAAGLTTDRAGVEAALSLSWSNGQVEGQVNRLKFIKRQMYGRASFDLLRARVVPSR